MFGLLVIFGQLWGEPWYGKNAGLMEGLPTGLPYVQLTWSYFLSVPGPIAAQRHSCAALNLLDEPQCAGSRHDQTHRVGTHDALVFATLILPQTSEGVGVTKSNFHRPAGAILAPDVRRAQGESGGEKGCDGWGWFSLPVLFAGGCARTPQHYDPHEAPRHHRVPQSIPGLELGAHFAGVGRPPCGGLRQGFGRANQGAFFARGATPLGSWGGRHLIALGTDRETSHDMGGLGQLPERVLGGIATVSQAPDGAPGYLLHHEVEDGARQLTAGLIRHVAGVGLRCVEREFASSWDAEVVAGPTVEGDVHDAQHAVHAAQRTVCLTCGPRTIAGAGEPLAMRTGFFLGGLVEAAPNHLALGHPLCREADDGTPELPTFVVEGTPEENREAGKVLDGGRPGQPPIGRNGVAVPGQGPAAGQSGKGLPRRSGKDTLKQCHHHSSKGRVYKGAHGNLLQQESLSGRMTYLPGIEVVVALA
jgi:hypothetical protein